jgi:uncharacterized protein (TIGR00251 family)
MSGPFTETPEGLRLALRVTPRSGANALGEVRDGRLQVRVTAPPEDGKANAAVLKLLAKAFGIPASGMELLSGAASREKLLLLRGLDYAGLPAVLRRLLGEDNQPQ